MRKQNLLTSAVIAGFALLIGLTVIILAEIALLFYHIPWDQVLTNKPK